MDEATNHLLSQRYWELIPPNERNHAMRFIYTCLLEAISEGADKFVLKADHLEWYKKETIIGHFPPEKLAEPQPSYSTNLHTILDRDIILRRHIHIVSETPTETTVLIVTDGES